MHRQQRTELSAKRLSSQFKHTHIIAMNKHGLMVQILAGLTTYLLISIYCHNNFDEKVSIKLVRELRIKIVNELQQPNSNTLPTENSTSDDQKVNYVYANT